MLIISFDAVGDRELSRLMEYPTFSAFAKQAALFKGVPTLCPSNTYPIHTSVATGVLPKVHGLISNTEAFPKKYPWWNYDEAKIRVKTLWQAARERGLKVAAVFWPVTGYSKSIAYNIPEIMPRPGEKPISMLLKAGSTALVLKMGLRHRKLLNGLNQPNRDAFAAACMADILRKHKPGLALMHLTAFDTLCHINGVDSKELDAAYKSLDDNLAILLEAAGSCREVIIFSDHSQRNVHTVSDPNDMLTHKGLLQKKPEAFKPGGSGCFFECCGGTAFFHSGNLAPQQVDEIRAGVAQIQGFRRFLTEDEIHGSGYAHAAFGFSAEDGHAYFSLKPPHKADHGYPIDMPEYTVFYMVKGAGFEPGSVTEGGSLLDIAPIVSKHLGLDGVGK